MPLSTLDNVNVLDNFTYMQERAALDVANVGYYKTALANGVTAELSATHHAGIIYYHFSNVSERHILVDISHMLPSSGEAQHSQFYSNGYLERNSDGSRYQGYGIYRGGFSSSEYDPRYDCLSPDSAAISETNLGPDAPVYFCADFDMTPRDVQFFSGPYTDPYWPNSTFFRGPVFRNESSISGGDTLYGYADRIGGLFSFPSNISTLKSRIGVSFVSTTKACQYLSSELSTWDIMPVISAAKEQWNTEVLSKVTTTDKRNSTLLRMLYSGLYHMHLMPSDRTGDNQNWETEEPSYDDFYTLWDTFRCLNSFYVLTAPMRAATMIRSLIDIWRFERFMPDGRSGNYNGRV